MKILIKKTFTIILENKMKAEGTNINTCSSRKSQADFMFGVVEKKS
jgi:hypothetical protein